MLDECVVMPNHFHAIVVISNVYEGLARQAPTTDTSAQEHTFSQPQRGSLGTIIGAFKSAVTKRINATHALQIADASPVTVWQRNYYEHIIRDERELLQIRRYIIENPARWERDTENPHK